MNSLMSSIMIFLGGGLGSLLRWLLSRLSVSILKTTWPATLLVNVIGSIILIYLFKESSNLSVETQKFIRVGLLGGLTTFSTFSFEIFNSLKTGNYVLGFSIFVLNIVCGIVIAIIIFR